MPIDGAVEVVTEEIATNLEEVAAVTRGISGKGVSLVVSGLVIGAAAGFYLGWRWNKEKIKAEIFKESEAEVAKLRDFYQEKYLRQQAEKPSIEDVIEEKGYSVVEETPAPPPKRDRKKTGKRPTKPSVVVREPVIPPPTPPPPPKDEDEIVWDYAKELESRTPELPYVISQEEFNGSTEGYRQVVYTYFAGDDVLVGEDERPLPHSDIIVGQKNLKFGHGSDDVDVVFIRNEHMELEMEVCRLQASYAQAVLGLDHDESS